MSSMRLAEAFEKCGVPSDQARGMVSAFADEAERSLVSRCDLQVEGKRIRREIINAKYDLPKRDVAAAGIILTAVYAFS